jgi:hypothetical protein
MADRRTPLEKALDRTKRELSLRLLRARREGHLWEEMKAIEEEGMRAFRKELNGKSNGQKLRRK